MALFSATAGLVLDRREHGGMMNAQGDEENTER
jgi:hypothetical protein